MHKYTRFASASRRALNWRASFHRLRASMLAVAGLSTLVLGAATLPRAQAANNAWSTTPADNTFTGINWTTGTTTPGAPTGTIAPGDDLYFGTSSIVALNENEAAGFSINSFTFNAGASAYTITGNSFALGAAGITNNSASLQTINDAFTMAATSTFTTSTGGGNLALGGVISGGGGFTKSGAGTLTLGGSSTYTGGTIVSGGTLTLNKGGAAGTVQGVVTVNTGATLSLTAGDALGYTAGVQVSTINVNGGAVTSSSGNQGYLTSFSLTGGTVSGTSLFRFSVKADAAPTITSLASATTSTFASNIDNFTGGAGAGSGLLGISVATGTVVGGVDLTISGSIISGGGITKTGAGYLNLTSSASTFTGPVVINGGTVNIGASAAATGSAGALGLSNAGKTITINTGATLSGTANNWFGNQTNVGTLPAITVNAGSLTTTRYTTVGALNLNGATMSNSATDTGNYQSFALRGNVTVGGSTPSTISTSVATGTTGGVHLGANTLFTVADVNNTAATDLTVSAPLRDQSGDFVNAAGGFTKAGLGTMTLTGASTYTGVTTVSAGTLVFGAGGTLYSAGTFAGSLVVGTGTTVRFDGNDALGGSAVISPVVVTANGGTLASNNSYTSLSNPVFNGATIIGNGGPSAAFPAFSIRGTVTVGGTTATNINAGTGANNNVALGTFNATGDSVTFNVADATSSAVSDLNVNTFLSNQGNGVANGLIKTGAGTMTLSGSNTYTGSTNVNGGTLAFSGTGSVYTDGTVAGALNVASGATLRFDRNDTLGNSASVSPVVVTVAGGTLASNNSYTSLNNPVFNGATIIDNGGASNGFNAFRLAGTVTVGGSTATNINAGTTNAFTGINIGANVGGTTTTTFNVGDATGNANSDLNVNVPVLNTNTVIEAAGALTKIGAGTMSLNVANTYTGATTVNAGTLLVNGSTGTDSVVTVNNTGSVLGGSNGTISGATTINAGGTITGADLGTVGALTLASTVTFNGGTFAVDISGATADRLNISGALSLTNANITFTGTPTAPSYVLASFASYTGSFAGTAPSGYSFQFNAGGTELDLVAVPVPEPATWMAGCLLIGLTGLSQRRRIGGWLSLARG